MIPVEAACPHCGREHENAEAVTCACGVTLTRVVPAIAPPMGGPAWWGWQAPDGRVSWEATR